MNFHSYEGGRNGGGMKEERKIEFLLDGVIVVSCWTKTCSVEDKGTVLFLVCFSFGDGCLKSMIFESLNDV